MLNKKNILIFCCLFFSIIRFAMAQNAPKREFRGVWIATVANIDWPSRPGLSASQQQQEFTSRLDFLKSNGFNAVIVQVRPAADAFYESSYEPWSKYLSGKQGQPPFPKYDPLTFMIRETHKRNMEFHAWFNPFRALVNSAVNPNPPNHVTRIHPDWIIRYGGKSYFDPGNPDARNYILKVITDVVKRYDIDGVHIDDYFYPYPEGGRDFSDGASFAKYNNNLSKADWRRNNVNIFVSQLNRMIKAEKPWVCFGVSPFGIWRNSSKSADGSATNGISCYDDLYSDIRLWLQNKWVDYVAPQLYWEHNHKAAPFNVLLPWWANNAYGRNLYIGLGVYKMVNGQGVWSNTGEILQQIKESRQLHTEGIVMYSASSFDKIGPALSDSLRNNYFKTIALPPAMPGADENEKLKAPDVAITIPDGNAVLKWNGSDPDIRYVVYRFTGNEEVDINKGENIIAFIRDPHFTDSQYAQFKNVRYVVTAFDRYGNESAAGATVMMQ